MLIREAELELADGLNAITGETGAGKTILSQAVGLLLGAKGDAAAVGPDAAEAYVEAELELPDGLLDEEGFEALAELRPEDEDGLVLARRIFGDGRTRAYAWGRSVAREDVAAVAERLIAMSGQFEQRRLARPSYQLDVLDSFVGEEQLRRRAELRRVWRELLAARRRHEELSADAAQAEARVEELRALVADTAGLEPSAEDDLRGERERLRHVTELAEGVGATVEALAPDEGEGAGGLVARAERALAPLEQLAPELQTAAADLRDVEVRVRETALELRSFLTSLEAQPDRLEQVEAELDRIAETKRRFRCATFAELLARTAEARMELDALADGVDPVTAAGEARAAAEARVRALAEGLSQARREAAEPFAQAVAGELESVGFGEGEFAAELGERELGPTGADDVRFLIRPNPGLPFAPAAETASGGELSRIALALKTCLAPSGPARTLVFDEIDTGVGGRAADGIGRRLKKLAAADQILCVTHLAQVASFADHHYVVSKKESKGRTHAIVDELDATGRVKEVGRMLSGERLTEEALRNAEQLIKAGAIA